MQSSTIKNGLPAAWQKGRKPCEVHKVLCSAIKINLPLLQKKQVPSP
jgi:hypothetical protein